EIVRWMSPFGSQPGVVKIQPANGATDIECRGDWVEFEPRSRHARAVWHHGAGYHWSQQLRASRILQRQKPAAQGVHQAIARRLIRLVAGDSVICNILSDLHQ